MREGRGVSDEDDGGRVDVPRKTAKTIVVKVVSESELVERVEGLAQGVRDVGEVSGLEVLDGLLQEGQVFLPA